MKAVTKPSIASVRCNFSLGFGLNIFFRTVTTKIAAKKSRNAATPNQPNAGNINILSHSRSTDNIRIRPKINNSYRHRIILLNIQHKASLFIYEGTVLSYTGNDLTSCMCTEGPSLRIHVVLFPRSNARQYSTRPPFS